MGDTVQESTPDAQTAFLAIFMVGFMQGFAHGARHTRENPDDTFQFESFLMPVDSKLQCGPFHDEPGRFMVSTRTFNCLTRAGVHTIRALIRLNPADVLAIQGTNQKTVDEIVYRLSAYGYQLAES